MFDRIFSEYLLVTGKLMSPDIDLIFNSQETSRARLGVIAVMEKLMTVEQADEVNHLQSIYDKLFGDIAIENGYLTQGQVERLIALQGNRFLSFLQTIVDLKLLSMDEINASLDAYQVENSLTAMNIEDLKSCSVSRIIPIFLFQQSPFLQDYAGLLARTMIRLLDYRAYIGTPHTANEVSTPCLSMQQLLGDHSIMCAIHAHSDHMIAAAKLFAGEKYITTTEDALDALCELINCINGMFATDLSKENIELDMDIPHYYLEYTTLSCENILCIPIKFMNCEFEVCIAVDQEFNIQ